MTETKTNETYVLGSSEQEHERLIRQAGIFSTITERLFQDAGVASGHRVLDLGSGLGDVAMLACRLVGPSGTVLGVDNDARSLAKAKTRVAEAGLRNVTFVESDLTSMENVEPFDAIVGRFILEFLPSPGVVVSSICEKLKPGGVVAIQDACWGPFLQLCSHLPLRSKCADLIYQSFQRSGANMDMELVLYRIFQEAGLAPPRMRVEIPIGDEPDIRNYVCDLFYSLYPRLQQQNISTEGVGNIATLRERLEAERTVSKSFGACQALVGAWSRKRA
jgi:ubiquinone/menaquinone biosynthesis C-methylase UbiE